jgi:chromosome segregation ATPase
VAALPGEGFHDLSRRFRIAWLWIARLRLRRALMEAEGELGWLGWEQVDFFDNEINAEVDKVREFENTQASLMNTSAELSGQKAALDEDLAGEKTLHDQTQQDLAGERGTIAGQLEQAEGRRSLRLGAVERFERALEEMARVEKELEGRSVSFMNVDQPDMETRKLAREISDELARLPGERRLVLSDKATAAEEAGRLESEITNLRIELARIDATASAARERLAAATHRIAGEIRRLEQKRETSSQHMSRLDREKKKPYRAIGACLADHGIAPLNQPEMLERVFSLRERDAFLTQSLADLQAACAAMDTGVLIAFYLLLGAVLFAASILGIALLRH